MDSTDLDDWYATAQQVLTATEIRQAASAQAQQQAAITAQSYLHGVSSAAGITSTSSAIHGNTPGTTWETPVMEINGKVKLGDHEFEAQQLGQLFKMLLRDYPELNI